MSVFKNDCQGSWNKYTNPTRIGRVLPKATPLRIATIAGSYKDLLHVSNGNGGIDNVLKALYDGSGKNTGIKVSKNSTAVNSENIEISNQVSGSSVCFIKKIDLNTEDEIIHNIKNSNHILVEYSGEEDGLIEKGITIKLDDLFYNQSDQPDEYVASFLHFHCSSNMLLQISLNFSINDYQLPFPAFIASTEKVFYIKSFMIMTNRILDEKIELMELENAELA